MNKNSTKKKAFVVKVNAYKKNKLENDLFEKSL